MKRHLLSIALAFSMTAGVGPHAWADAVYHSERLPFSAALADGHPTLEYGAIVNIHPNGPVMGAIQRFTVVGARPNTVYSIFESIFPDCSEGAPRLLVLPRGTLTTDARGNGQAEFVISAEDLAPYAGLTIGAQWTLEDAGVVAYYTPCTIGSID
jgi:hypothetical protein